MINEYCKFLNQCLLLYIYTDDHCYLTGDFLPGSRRIPRSFRSDRTKCNKVHYIIVVSDVPEPLSGH